MSHAEITPAIVAEHGFTPDEYDVLVASLGRVPNMLELGIFSVMWSEHCSYKSSRIHLAKLPTKAPWVIHGPGENAGVIDIGAGPDGVPMAAVFTMDSPNHPGAIQPYQGAAPAGGGIRRDACTVRARAIGRAVGWAVGWYVEVKAIRLRLR